jgi:hypothetical protein
MRVMSYLGLHIAVMCDVFLSLLACDMPLSLLLKSRQLLHWPWPLLVAGRRMPGMAVRLRAIAKLLGYPIC